tara:strand:- start:49388 stop:49897 length:510 start_codon:yes stop_codon:yes gene_type:complete
MSNFNTNTNTNNQPQRSDRNKYTIYLIGFLVLVIIGLVIFGVEKFDTSDLEDEIEELMAENEKHIKRADSLELSITKYKEISEEFIRKDSLNSIEIQLQKDRTAWLRKQQILAQLDREKTEEELEDFKKNPPNHDLNSPYNLLIDTERKINNDKKNDTITDNYDDNNNE